MSVCLSFLRALSSLLSIEKNTHFRRFRAVRCDPFSAVPLVYCILNIKLNLERHVWTRAGGASQRHEVRLVTGLAPGELF